MKDLWLKNTGRRQTKELQGSRYAKIITGMRLHYDHNQTNKKSNQRKNERNSSLSDKSQYDTSITHNIY